MLTNISFRFNRMLICFFSPILVISIHNKSINIPKLDLFSNTHRFEIFSVNQRKKERSHRIRFSINNFYMINCPTNCFECPSSVYINRSSYSLSFGFLLSGNVSCSQPCIDDYPTDYYRSLKPINQSKVNEAMKTIRKRTQKPSIPTVPFCYNSLVNNYKRCY